MTFRFKIPLTIHVGGKLCVIQADVLGFLLPDVSVNGVTILANGRVVDLYEHLTDDQILYLNNAARNRYENGNDTPAKAASADY